MQAQTSEKTPLQLTEDGRFYPDDKAPFEVDGIPCVSGHVIISLTGEMREQLETYNTAFDDNVFVAGRSGHAQAGLDALRLKGEQPVIQASQIEIPLVVKSYLDKAGVKFLELLSRETNIRIARLILGLQNNALSKTEVEAAIANSDIMIGTTEYTVNPDGSLTIPVAPCEYRLSKTMLTLDEGFRKEILDHSRNALIGKQDLFPLKPGEMFNSQTFMVMGLPLSTGKYSAMIEPRISEEIHQLAAATYLGAFRSTRLAMLDELLEYVYLSTNPRSRTDDLTRLSELGPKIGLDFFRQLEIWNNGPAVNPHNLRARVKIYPHAVKQATLEKNWNKYSIPEKKRIHKEGHDTATITGIYQDEFRQQIFNRVTPDQQMYGKIITRNGVSYVPREESTLLQNQTTVTIANIPDSRETENIAPADQLLLDRLGDTKDCGRMLIAHTLPISVSHLFELYQAGIRVFLFRSLGEQINGADNIFLKPETHNKIWKLNSNGASFFFEINGQLREFYKGFWMKSETKERFDKVETVVSMYGTHKDGVFDGEEEKIREYFKELIKKYTIEKLAIAHGKGQGIMELADKIARKLGILSMGIGISVEDIGQGRANLKPEAILDFYADSISYRQMLLNNYEDLAVINWGGDGTNEESSIATCRMKILRSLPSPIIHVDPSGGSEHYFEGIRRQGERIAKGINGIPLGEAWVVGMKFFVSSYQEAGIIQADFRQDPCRFWANAGVPQEAIAKGYANQLAACKEYQRRMPQFLKEAAERYLAE